MSHSGKSFHTVSLRNVFSGEHFRRIAKGNQFAIEENDLVKEVCHIFQIVMGSDHEVALRGEVAKGLPKSLL